MFLSKNNSIDNLQTILERWCRASGTKFNIEKTEIIPLGNKAQRNKITTKRKLNEGNTTIPPNVHITKDGEPVRILGAWLGNQINQAVTWAPLVEDYLKRLK